jgi:hypothetical protein
MLYIYIYIYIYIQNDDEPFFRKWIKLDFICMPPEVELVVGVLFFWSCTCQYLG